MAVNIPEEVILIWPGTDASIPADWVRETALDGKFIKATADGVDPAVTGGSDSHSHTSPAHTHNALPHRHYGQTVRAGSYETDSGPGGFDCARDNHYHDFDYTNISAGSLEDAVTYASGDSRPPFHEVIFIKPDGAPAEPPDGIIALFSKSTLPTDWDICDGNNSTPDLDGKFLRGAAAAGDAGATGGSLTHTHSINHTHSAKNHYHDGNSFGDSDRGNRYSDTVIAPGGQVVPYHSHNIHLDNVSDAGSAYVGTAGSADTVEPLHRRLLALQNNTGGVDRPRFLIGLWLGALADIPAGWSLCDGQHGTIDMRGYHLKVTDSLILVGDTGGSNTHSHAPSNSHTHTATAPHTHTGFSSAAAEQYRTGSRAEGASLGHSHSSLASCSSATTTWQEAMVQANAANGEPAFMTVAFIEFTGIPIEENRYAVMRGQIATSHTRRAKLRATNPAGEARAKLIGRQLIRQQRRASISGKIRWVRTPKEPITELIH